MFMMFHTTAKRRPWLIALSSGLLLIGIIMLLAKASV